MKLFYVVFLMLIIFNTVELPPLRRTGAHFAPHLNQTRTLTAPAPHLVRPAHGSYSLVRMRFRCGAGVVRSGSGKRAGAT